MHDVLVRLRVEGGGEGCSRGWVCPCDYFTLFFCKHTLVGSTLHFTESNKLTVCKVIHGALNFSSDINYRILLIFGHLSRYNVKCCKNRRESLCSILVVVKCLLCVNEASVMCPEPKYVTGKMYMRNGSL